jgi:signal transduction histidine kinase
VVIISITDTGPGISERDSEKLFSLEHTVSTGTHGEKGNRLGLVLVKDMLLQNNGNIRFETQTGKGTTFWIELPAGKAYLLVTTPTSVLEETKESKK